ncbi:MAG: hypothetical protein ACI4P3_01825, partial [Candidatus Spyradosoma sp.]
MRELAGKLGAGAEEGTETETGTETKTETETGTETKTETAGTETAGAREEGTEETERTEGGTEETNPANGEQVGNAEKQRDGGAESKSPANEKKSVRDMTNEELIREWKEGKRLEAVKLEEADTPEVQARRMEGARRSASAEFELLRREGEEIDALVQKWLADLRAGKSLDWREIEPAFEEIWKRYTRMFGHVKDGVEQVQTLGDFGLTRDLMSALQELVDEEHQTNKAFAEEDFKECYEKFRAWHAEKSKLVDSHEEKLGRRRAEESAGSEGSGKNAASQEATKSESESPASGIEEIRRGSDAVNAIEESDFSVPSRDVELPEMTTRARNTIGLPAKKILIKKNVFEKNLREHPDTNASDGKKILAAALYAPDFALKDKPKLKPNYWVLVKVDGKSAIVVIDTDPKKDRIEVVGWHWSDEKNNARLERRAQRNESEGGKILMTNPDADRAAFLSALPLESVQDSTPSDNGVNSEGGASSWR